MENEYYGVIYKITNLINNKIYIGQTKQMPERRWMEHKSYANSKTDKHNMVITKSMIKYGVEKFNFKIIDYAYSAIQLNKLEEFYIKQYNSLTPFGYNIQSYSDTSKVISEETKIKTTKSLVNKKRSNSSSKYFGVTFDKVNNRWQSIVIFRKNIFRLGSYDTEIEAAQSRDIFIINEEYYPILKLNFPELKESYLNNEIIILKTKDKKHRHKHQGIKKTKNPSSKYKGVYLNKKSNKWESKICYMNKRYWIGHYDNEIDAAKAYDQKTIELIGIDSNLNFPEEY